jgi:hypothetical protein
MLAQLVTYVDGAVTFLPGQAIVPVITGVCAAVAVGAGLFLVVDGTRRILQTFRSVGGSDHAPDAWDKRQAHEGRWDRGEMYQWDEASPTGSSMRGPAGVLP